MLTLCTRKGMSSQHSVLVGSCRVHMQQINSKWNTDSHSTIPGLNDMFLAAIFATVSFGGGMDFTRACSSRTLHAIFRLRLSVGGRSHKLNSYMQSGPINVRNVILRHR